jgi:tetratricopeptide (TPR) repeat protein
MRQKLLLALLVVVAVAAVAFRFAMSRSDTAAAPPAVASQQLLSDLMAMRDAEKIADRHERCLAYPDLPGVVWDKSVVQAYCDLMLRKAMSLYEIDDALKRGEIETLRQTFDGYLQRNYENGQHGFLTWAINHAFAYEASLDVADRWVKADPNSAFALLARGTAYAARAGLARGNKFARDTSEDQFERMHEFAAKAVDDLNESVHRSHRLIAAYNEMFVIAQMTGDDDLRAQSVRRALALDPADQWTYDRWSDAVEPKWGGSIGEMSDIADRAMKHADDNPLLKRMPARPYCAEANTLEVCQSCGSTADRATRAMKFYMQAASVAPAACMINEAGATAERAGDYESAVRIYSQSFRFSGDLQPLFRRSVALRHLGQEELALETIDVAERAQPNNPMAFVNKGWIYQEDHKPQEAEKSFLAAVAIDRDNREANTELVMLYTTSLNQFDKGKAIVDRMMSEDPNNPRAWLLSAVLDHGKDDKHCKVVLEKYLALVDREKADSYEQRDIDRATARVKELTAQEEKTAAAPSATK